MQHHEITELPRQQAHTQAEGWFQCQVVRDGVVLREHPPQHNLILNQGMNRVAVTPWLNLTDYCNAGTGNTPTSDDSGATTAAQAGAGTTVVLSGGTFVFTNTATDAGKMIKWDSGQEARIVTVTSPTQVEVLPAATISAGEFTVYRTNQTTLAAHVKRSNTYLVGAGNTETTLAANVLSHRTTYDFTAETGPVAYQEIAVGWGTGATDIFNRMLTTGVVTVNSGEQLRVVYQLNLTLTPNSSTPATAAISGWSSTDGDEAMQLLGLKKIELSTGAHNAYYSYNNYFDGGQLTGEPGSGGSVFVSTTTTAPAAFGSSVSRTDTGSVGTTTAAYVAHNHYVDKTGLLGVGVGNSAVIRSMGYGNGSSAPVMIYVFDNNMTKLNTYTLSLTWRFSWGRTLA